MSVVIDIPNDENITELKKGVELGMFKDMSDGDYSNLGNPKDVFATGGDVCDMVWRCTDIKDISKKGLFDYFYGVEQKSKDAFTFGNALHTFVLEPHLFEDRFIVLRNKTTKIDEDDNRLIISGDDFELIKKMNALIQKKYGVFLNRAKDKEIVFVGEIGGIKVKAKIDIPYSVDEVNKTISFLDLKSTRHEVHNYDVVKDAFALGYDLQVAYYADVIESCGLGYKIISNGLLYSSSKDGNCQLTEVPLLMMEIGREKYQKALQQIKSYYETKSFAESGFSITHKIPDYLVRQYEQNQ